MVTAEELILLARAAATRAYAPYSNYFVGAAIVFENAPRVYSGCNVENASYGLTICAERVAACAGVAAGFNKISDVAIALLDKNKQPAQCFMPCGACRQFLAEFATDKTRVIVDNYGSWQFGDLLPHAFRCQHE